MLAATDGPSNEGIWNTAQCTVRWSCLESVATLGQVSAQVPQ